MSDSVRPHRWQPTRLPRPWDSPGKNTGVGCHVLLHCMTVKSQSEVAQSCPTLCDPIDGSPPGSAIPGILHAILWNSAFRCFYLSFSPLLFASLLFTAICKASPVSHFAFLQSRVLSPNGRGGWTPLTKRQNGCQRGPYK